MTNANAAWHGQARNARVAVADFPGFWRVTVDNDGIVLTQAELDWGEGLGLRNRTQLVVRDYRGGV
ncbi:hypothetical protein [Actinomyces trachealis]|uniref:hypothetical protein n=1 Tax=Actinomyces trachealis TaxID=2763540 RepID=UPI0018C63486|nr:hypothetical protein [Actinomyces trachealis]